MHYYLLLLWFITGYLSAAELKPSPPLQLTQALPIEISDENRQQLIDNPKRLEDAEKYNQQAVQAKRFPWIELGLISLLGLFALAVKAAPPVFPKRKESPAKQLARFKQTALQNIASLSHKQLKPRQQSQVLSFIVRQFIENAYQVHAPKQTTEEFLQVASQDTRFSAETKIQLQYFLISTDRAKFARSANGESLEQLSQTAQAFIKSINIT